ncbi:MAG: DNA integrity scanning protein DisA nucleotide-binding domain protein [Magnetococcus sp. YQC-5]
MFDPKIITEILSLWKPDSADTMDPLVFQHVKTIMEMVFLAGLKRDEDRPVRVGVSLIDPASLPDRGRAGESIVFRMEPCSLLTVDTLVKLAPAFDPETTVLAVWSAEHDPNLLVIWSAIFTTHRGRNRFDALPIEQPSPDTLTIITKKTGSLSIHQGDTLIARFKSGRFLEPVHSHFTSELMGWRFLEIVKQHPEFKELGMKYWYTYRDFIDYLLMETEHRGHGGIIVWLPSEIIDTESHCIIPKHNLTESPDGALLLADLCTMEQKQFKYKQDLSEKDPLATICIIGETILECKRKVIEHAELLAQMTCVDGALILSDRLRPLSFGAFLSAPIWQGNTIYWKNNKAQPLTRAELFTKYGTRHNAAVNFVGHYPGSAAFVISQDGPISGLTKKDEHLVHWWPDCLGKY